MSKRGRIREIREDIDRQLEKLTDELVRERYGSRPVTIDPKDERDGSLTWDL